MSERPHRSVLLMIADDWSRIGPPWGEAFLQMPNVEAAARRGVRFDNAFCASPSCAVSRANILTGLHGHTHGQYGHCHGIHTFRTHQWLPSIPGVLNQHGFATACIGKKHVQPQSVYPFQYEAIPEDGGARSPAGMGRLAKDWLDSIGGKPFYAHVGFSDPHRSPTNFGNERAYPDYQEIKYDPGGAAVPDFLPDIPEARRELAEYYQALSRLDSGFGQVMRALEESGRAQDTLILILSDHAMPFPGAKASMYDSGHNCPLIVVTPGRPDQGAVCDAMVSWTDIMPTVLDWCGVDPPEGLFGRSILPPLGQEHPPGWDEVFFSHNFHEVTNYYPYRALRERQYKYVLNLFPELSLPLPSDLYASPTWQAILKRRIEKMGRRPTQNFLRHTREELYDIQADPLETNNLAGDPKHAERLEAMRAKVQQFRHRTHDPWLLSSIQNNEPGAAEVGPPELRGG